MDKHRASRALSGRGSRETEPEMLLGRALHIRGLLYQFTRGRQRNDCRCGFRTTRVALFIDVCFLARPAALSQSQARRELRSVAPQVDPVASDVLSAVITASRPTAYNRLPQGALLRSRIPRQPCAFLRCYRWCVVPGQGSTAIERQ